MGLEINTKEDLLKLIKELKDLGLNEIDVKIPNLELSIKNNNPSKVYALSEDDRKSMKRDESKASASQILEIFSRDIEELNPDAR